MGAPSLAETSSYNMTSVFLVIDSESEFRWKKTKVILAILIWCVCFSIWRLRVPAVEPFDFVMTGVVPENTAFKWLILLIILGCLLIPRFYCRYLCPVGGMLSLLPVWKPRGQWKPKSCRECHACIDSCPVNALRQDKDNKVILDPGECIACNACRRACDKAYRIDKGRKGLTEIIAENHPSSPEYNLSEKTVILSIKNWICKDSQSPISLEIVQGQWIGLTDMHPDFLRSLINPGLKLCGEMPVKPDSIGLLGNPVDLGWSHRTVKGELETDPANAKNILDKFGLKGKEMQDPFSLSYGEKWCLGLAKLSVKNPSLLLLDKVWDKLDDETVSILQNALLSLSPPPAVLYTT